MPSSSSTKSSGDHQKTQTFAFIAMTCLFFFWGFITVLNDILIPFLKDSFDLNYTQAMLVQFCFFGAYFIISPFAGKLIDKVGYQQGIVLGLLTTAVGCFLFYPSADLNVYELFLFSFFVLASGVTILQVAANPYVAALGPDKTAASRLNLAQAANSLGTTVGPLVGAALILGVVAADASAVQGPYLILGSLLVLVAVMFRFIKLPRITSVESDESSSDENIWDRRSLVLGALAIFLYVGGEVSIGSFLVNYFAESSIGGLSHAEAGEMVAYYWGAAMIGRLVGAAAMNYKLGVQSGTTSDTYAAAELANAEVSAFDSIDLAIEALKQGDVDFVLGDLPTLKFYQADSDGLSIAGSFSEEDFGIGVAPGEADLLAAINVALGEIIASGEYDTIFAATFGDEIVVLTDDTNSDTATAYPAEPSGQLADALEDGNLKFGTDPYYPPFESYTENTTDMVGFDVDIANAIAAKIAAAYDQNLSAIMVEKTWDDLLAFGYDNYDVTLSAMTKTAQRAENTDFSRAYYSSKQGILASAASPTITGVGDLNGTYDIADDAEEDDSPSITVLASALAIGLIAVSRRKN